MPIVEIKIENWPIGTNYLAKAEELLTEDVGSIPLARCWQELKRQFGTALVREGPESEIMLRLQRALTVKGYIDKQSAYLFRNGTGELMVNIRMADGNRFNTSLSLAERLPHVIDAQVVVDKNGKPVFYLGPGDPGYSDGK